jgi:lincosamide nucleotidyltransferase A/C/D/E
MPRVFRSRRRDLVSRQAGICNHSRMMAEADLLDVVGLLQKVGVRAWVDGGWGVDALAGRTTREHADLDLVVPLVDLDVVRRVLGEAGYCTVLRDWLPTALALTDGQGHEIDLHPVARTVDGGGDQAQPEGGSFHYPRPVEGVIDGHRVPCVDALTQVRCHLGYEPSDKDRRDTALLAESCGVELPPPYARRT